MPEQPDNIPDSNEVTDITHDSNIMGNNEVTYSNQIKGSNEQTFIPFVENHNEHVDRITTKPLQVVQAPSISSKQGISRRGLLLGGGIALLALAGGGTALTLALTNAGKQTTSQLSSPTPTVVPRPRSLVAGKGALTIQAHSDAVTSVTWDPTGRYLASSGDMSIKVWDVGNMLDKQAAGPLALSRPAWARLFTNTADFSSDTLHWSADGRQLITLVFDQKFNSKPVLLSPFTSNTKEQIFTNTTLKNATSSYTPMPAPRGTTLAAIDITPRRYHKVDLWQMNRPSVPFANLIYQDPDEFVGDFTSLNIIGWSCDGSLLAGLFSSQQYSRSRSLVVWDVKTRAVKATLPVPGLSADMAVFRLALSWSPVDPHLLAVFNLNAIAVVDVNQGKILYQLATDDSDAFNPVKPNRARIPLVIAICWSPDGRYIAGSFASSNKVYIWDTQAKNAPAKNGARLQQLIFPQANDPLVHHDSISDISWSPDGRFLATASYDKSIKVWKVDQG